MERRLVGTAPLEDRVGYVCNRRLVEGQPKSEIVIIVILVILVVSDMNNRLKGKDDDDQGNCN